MGKVLIVPLSLQIEGRLNPDSQEPPVKLKVSHLISPNIHTSDAHANSEIYTGRMRRADDGVLPMLSHHLPKVSQSIEART